MEQQMVDEKINICFLSLTSKGRNGRLEATIKIVSSANQLEIVILIIFLTDLIGFC